MQAKNSKDISIIIEKCYNNKDVINRDEAEAVLDVLGQVISAYLSRNFGVRIKNLGTFILNKHGFIRFKSSTSMRKIIRSNKNVQKKMGTTSSEEL